MDLGRIREEIARMARDNALWLGSRRIVARTVTIKVRYDDFTTITRSHSHAATSDPDEIARRAVALLEKTDAGQRPVRLLGAGVHNLEPLGGPAVAEGMDGVQLRFEE
jgi:DNA polymerase-4